MPTHPPSAVFHEILTKLAPNWDESFLNMELLFEGFDSRGDRVLDFEELINGLNVLYYGDVEAKLRRACHYTCRDDLVSDAPVCLRAVLRCVFASVIVTRRDSLTRGVHSVLSVLRPEPRRLHHRRRVALDQARKPRSQPR